MQACSGFRALEEAIFLSLSLEIKVNLYRNIFHEFGKLVSFSSIYDQQSDGYIFRQIVSRSA